jgi:site-specific recombinase XerD
VGSEMCIRDSTMDDFIIIKNKLWLQVNGKGNKYGRIPILTHLEIRLNRYREIYNLPSIRDKTSSESHIPLVIMSKYSENNYRSVAHDYIWHTVKSICRNLANTISTDNIMRSRLNRVSPHWLRHTSATIQINSGINIKVVQANLRHSSIKTTLLYLHIEDDVRYQETITKFTSKLIT